MGSNWIYGVAVVREDDQFRAVCDEAPEAIAYGATEADALREMVEALKAVVRGRIHMKLDLVPPAGDPAAQHHIGLPAQLAAKASVYVAWRASGLSMSRSASASIGARARCGAFSTQTTAPASTSSRKRPQRWAGGSSCRSRRSERMEKRNGTLLDLIRL